MSDVEQLFHALAVKSKFEVVNHTLSPNQLRVIGRIPADQMGQCMQNWLIIARNLLIAAENGTAWKVDIAKQYFLKGPEGAKKIVYGHRLIVQAENVTQYFDQIISVIAGSKQSAVVEMTSFPLPGAGPNRNTGRNGKGANTTAGQ